MCVCLYVCNSADVIHDLMQLNTANKDKMLCHWMVKEDSPSIVYLISLNILYCYHVIVGIGSSRALHP